MKYLQRKSAATSVILAATLLVLAACTTTKTPPVRRADAVAKKPASAKLGAALTEDTCDEGCEICKEPDKPLIPEQASEGDPRQVYIPLVDSLDADTRASMNLPDVELPPELNDAEEAAMMMDSID